MKDSLLVLLAALIIFPVGMAGRAYGQAVSPSGPAAQGVPTPPQVSVEGTGPPGGASMNFPSAAGGDFPDTTASTGVPPTANPEGPDTTMPESGMGTGTDSTFGGSGTGSGGLGESTYGPYTESPLGTR